MEVFSEKGDFKAYYAACEWCKKNGISYGSMQRDYPIGLMRGDWDISKWLNMTRKEQAALDGEMTGDKRNGPITITMKR